MDPSVGERFGAYVLKKFIRGIRIMNALAPESGRLRSDLFLMAGFVVLIAFFVVTGYASYSRTEEARRDTGWVMHTHTVLIALTDILRLARDAESHQRGYILTGDPEYLSEYRDSLKSLEMRFSEVETLTSDNPKQQGRVKVMREGIDMRVDEMDMVINLRETQGLAAARSRIEQGRGLQLMKELATSIENLQIEERSLRAQRLEVMTQSYRATLLSILISAVLGIILTAAVTYLLARAASARRNIEWLQKGQLALAAAMAGDQTMHSLAQNILKSLCEYTGAHAGAFYARNGRGYKKMGTYGVPANADIPGQFDLDDGLLGQAARDGKPFFVHDAPENYLKIGSSFGSSAPRHLIIAPASADGIPLAVYELGYLTPPNQLMLSMLEEASGFIGVAVRSAKFRTDLQNLLEETQRQAEELQSQSEELRVSNEELEEQGRALRESQARLEQQQAELEQTNAQLEEQAQLLENQRDYLARAQADLKNRTNDLEKASQYKSDFLANMSHELRTPLNSSLILSKLLAENPQGNLSEEQVKFARTIHSAGNDLLNLINDILDLSKIEAGHMDVHPENVPIEWLSKNLRNVFEPVGLQKGVSFRITISEDAPKSIETDRQRLEQILKNLLSNAFKFTHKGYVEFSVSSEKDDRVRLSVTDTGIGMNSETQQAVFDAFRQADGTISRKYGGTGLGLSISRELSRLLGGQIDVFSKEGKGSTFSLILPVHYGQKDKPAETSLPSLSITEENGTTSSSSQRFRDDREVLVRDEKVILVVEDDEPFTRILYDLAHDMNFQCLIAGTAEEALAICRQYVPSAVVLDVGLPDNSGLSVLDRLKRDPRTRHIPVHVVSANDYAHTALSLGAAGYMLKPVKREELETAFQGLESRLSSTLRRILLVEDDPVQQDSIMRLFDTRNVETITAGTAAECLEHLRTQTFDCMVLDLSLPDASGYDLLEKISVERDYSFPPVIVYTGRELSIDEEQKLRRYSKSIIIKGAKSPERLLDEVTLFLHQVVSDLPPDKQKMIEKARHRDSILEGRRILVVEDDMRNIYAITNIFEPLGALVQVARNGREALEALESSGKDPQSRIHLVLMDVMMPEMDGLTATREIRKRKEWAKLPVIMLTAKAMKDDHERCIDAGANDYMAKPIDVEKLLSLVRVWMPR